MENVGWWALEGQSWENLVIMTSKSPSFYSRKIKRGYSPSRFHTVRGWLAQNKPVLWSLTPLFFLLYYYPPPIKSSCQKCTRSIFWSRTPLFVWWTITFSFSFPKSWFSFIRFLKNITATLCLKIMKLQRMSIELQCHKLMKSSMLKWMGGFSF